MLDVDLDGLAGVREFAASARAGTVTLEGDARHTVALENLVDRRDRHIRLVVPLQEEADADWTVLSFMPDLEDEGHDVRRRLERVVARPRTFEPEDRERRLAGIAAARNRTGRGRSQKSGRSD